MLSILPSPSKWRYCDRAALPGSSVLVSAPSPPPCQIFSRVRAQVREELRALLYGNQLVSLSGADSAEGGGAEDQAALPDSLLQWLAERYVSGADLRASLADLELSILRNVSRQLLQQEQLQQEQLQQQHLQQGGESANYAKVNNNEEDDNNHHHRRHQTVTQAVEDSLEAAGIAVTMEVFTVFSPSRGGQWIHSLLQTRLLGFLST